MDIDINYNKKMPFNVKVLQVPRLFPDSFNFRSNQGPLKTVGTQTAI